MKPYIPFIKGKVDCLVAMLFCLHRITKSHHRFYKLVHMNSFSKIILCGTVFISIVLVHGYIIHLLIRMFQYGKLPFSKGFHVVPGAPTRYQFDIRINQAHLLCCLGGQLSIFLCCFITNLPGSVHFISKTPRPDVKRLFKTIFSSHIGIIGICIGIAVFQ